MGYLCQLAIEPVIQQHDTHFNVYFHVFFNVFLNAHIWYICMYIQIGVFFFKQVAKGIFALRAEFSLQIIMVTFAFLYIS